MVFCAEYHRDVEDGLVDPVEQRTRVDHTGGYEDQGAPSENVGLVTDVYLKLAVQIIGVVGVGTIEAEHLYQHHGHGAATRVSRG